MGHAHCRNYPFFVVSLYSLLALILIQGTCIHTRSYLLYLSSPIFHFLNLSFLSLDPSPVLMFVLLVPIVPQPPRHEPASPTLSSAASARRQRRGSASSCATVSASSPFAFSRFSCCSLRTT